MQCLTGRPVSPGFAEGTAVVFNGRGKVEIHRYRIGQEDVDRELARLHEALDESHQELRQLERRVLTELGQSQSSIFSAHLGLLRDEKFVEGVRQRVRRELVNVEQALDAEVAELATLLGSLQGEYLRERAQDVRDVGNRVMRQLLRAESGRFSHLGPQSVVVIRELLPSEAIELDRDHVVAIVTEEGGENSHAAILARALGIPAVTGVTGATTSIADGARLLVDGQNGCVTITPSDSATREFAVRKGRYDAAGVEAAQAELLESVTQDGARVALLANINLPQEARLVVDHHLDGVGLFRTEFLYLEWCEPPSFERQVEIYRRVLHDLDGRPLVIRTLDVGGDKAPPSLSPRDDVRLDWSLRGLQFSLAHPEIFRTQLRAVLAAGEGRDVRLLFPMVLGASDLQHALEHLREVTAEQRIAPPLVGAMIETPSALFSLDEILRMVSFVSIGTNDLTQYMLAAHRSAARSAADQSVLHPSVLRAIHQVVQSCASAGREVGVCGEAAGDPRTACLLVGMGVKQLSMSPLRAARVRVQLRSSRHEELSRLAEQALRSESPDAVRHLLASLPSATEQM